MSILTICPCCSSLLLHHYCDRREYWFCRNCWQEMPSLDNYPTKKYQNLRKPLNLSIHFSKQKISV